jgi:hypothetical protein
VIKKNLVNEEATAREIGLQRQQKKKKNDSDEFPWAWNVPACDNKTFYFALQCYFVSKTIRCLWRSLHMKDVHTNGGTNHQDLCQTLIMTFK